MNFKGWLREETETAAEAQTDTSDSPESLESKPLDAKEKHTERKSACGGCGYFPFYVQKRKKRKHR